MSKVEKLMMAKPGKKESIFATEVRKRFKPNGMGIVTQLANQVGLNKKLVSKAFSGKAVTSSVASKVSRELGFEATQLFVILPPNVPKKERRMPSKLRQYL